MRKKLLLAAVIAASGVLSAPLNIDFTDPARDLDPRITYSRASQACRTNHYGNLEVVSSGVARAHAYQEHDPASYTTSASTQSVGYGSKTFAVSYAYSVGDRVRVTYDDSNWMVGTVTAASGSSVTLAVNTRAGSGSYSSWHVIRCLGLRPEESRTNLLLRSAELDHTTYTKTRSSISTNASSAPTGSMVADKLIEDATVANNHYCYQIVTIAPSTTYTWSVFAKAAERSWLGLSAYDGSTRLTFFNLANGTVGTSAAGNVATIQALPNGWYRCSVTRTSGAGSTGAIELYLATADNTITYTGDGASGLHLWGAQLEVGALATTYIPTTVAAAARLADAITIAGSAFTSVWNQLQGTVVITAAGIDTSDANGATVVCASDGTSSNATAIRRIGTTAQSRAQVYVGGATQFNSLVTSWPLGASAKVAMRYRANDFAAVLTGGVVVTDVSGSVPAVTQLEVGRFASGNYWNGTIEGLVIYRIALSDSQLQALVA